MESDYHWLITVGLVVSSVIAVTANFFLLVVFCKRRGLRTVPNRFIINLLVTNLMSSVLLIPLLLIDQDSSSSASNSSNGSIPELIIEEDILADPTTNSIAIIRQSNILEDVDTNMNHLFLCYLAQSTTSFICTASIFSILLIGINQYFGVIHSLRYHFYVNRCRSSVLIGSSWFLALLFAVLSSLTYSDSSVWHSCRVQRIAPMSDTIKVLNTVYAFGYFVCVIMAPFMAICAIYVCIYGAAHRNSERMRRSASAPLNPNLDYVQVKVKDAENKMRDVLPKVHSAPNFTVIGHSCVEDGAAEEEIAAKVTRSSSDRTASHNFIATIKHKISNASVLFRYREETRAAKISVLVIFMVLVCYVPYGLTLVLTSKCIDVSTSETFDNLSLVLLVFSNIISPFLFGYRNKRVKREIGKMLGLLPHKQKLLEVPRCPTKRSFEDVHETFEQHRQQDEEEGGGVMRVVPEVVVTCKPETERKSILKRVGSTWTSYKKCNFITVPDSCISGEARGSFSSASTQISMEE